MPNLARNLNKNPLLSRQWWPSIDPLLLKLRRKAGMYKELRKTVEDVTSKLEQDTRAAKKTKQTEMYAFEHLEGYVGCF